MSRQVKKEKTGMGDMVLDQLLLLQSLILTDQKTVDAMGARLVLIHDVLKRIIDEMQSDKETPPESP